MRAVFFGSPAFAVPALDALVDIADVAAVISQPDRPAGRGLSLRPPAVKARALELGLDVWQPTKLRSSEFAERLRSLQADVGVVVAYGRILPLAVLEAPRCDCVNVHASLLPRWRGAAPIQWAIVSGDERTGVTLMKMDEGMDTGPVLATLETPIDPDETGGELEERLSSLGATLLRNQLAAYVGGELEPEPQDGALATKARLLEKRDGAVDWARPVRDVHNWVRGMNPMPGSHTTLRGGWLKLHRCRASTLSTDGADPGEVIGADGDGIRVACATGTLVIDELQESGRKRMSAQAFVAGRRIAVGDRLGAGDAT